MLLDNSLVDEYQIKYAAYAGMASAAMRNVTKSQKMDSTVSVEGVSGVTPYVGKTDDVYKAFVANMKAGVSYIGASNLDEYREDVVYQRISLGGQHEKATHIIETKN
jgi:IMP dehydrogenase/GMP reductase